MCGRYCTGRAIVVEIEKGCLAEKVKLYHTLKHSGFELNCQKLLEIVFSLMDPQVLSQKHTLKP